MTEPTPGYDPSNPRAAAKAAKAYAKATRPWYRKKRWWALAIVVVIVAIAGVSNGGSSSDKNQVEDAGTIGSGTSTKTVSPTAEASDEPARGTSFKDGVLTMPGVRIEITDHKIIPAGKKGNEYGDKPVIAFWYKVTNLSGKKVDPMTEFISDMTAYQDNNPNAENELDVAGLPDDRFLDTQTENIKKGGTVENAVAYELDDLKTPVDLVASDDLGFSQIGKVRYQLK